MVLQRLFSRSFLLENGCLEWRGWQTRNGYGQVKTATGEIARVHRLAYEAFVGPIPEGFVVDHLCRNRKCWNPSHLEAVTQRTNVMRGEGLAAVNASKDSCDAGHLFDEANTYLRPEGGRACKTCRRSYRAAYRQRLQSVT